MAYLFLIFVLVLKQDRTQEVLPTYNKLALSSAMAPYKPPESPLEQVEMLCQSSAFLTTPPLSLHADCSVCCTQLSALATRVPKIE